jgi:HlyD family secretion protein
MIFGKSALFMQLSGPSKSRSGPKRNARFSSAFVIFATASLIACKSPPEVKLTKVSRAQVEATVSSVTSGTVRSEQIAELAFGTVGRVKTLNVQLGDTVKASQILAEVENEDLKSRLDVTREELERSRRLSQDQALSRSSFIQAQAAYDAAVTAYEKSLIRAPYDGIIAELNLEVGQLSQITAVIPRAPIRIVDLKPRYVRAEIDEVDFPKVKLGMPARVKILAVRREPFTGRVRKVVPFVSSAREQDRTSEIELDVSDEGNRLPVGASADVEIVTETHDDVLTVSSRAILGRGSDRYVYVVDGGKLAKRSITVGIFGFTVSEIQNGLSEGEEVVLPSDKVDLTPGLAVSVSR